MFSEREQEPYTQCSSTRASPLPPPGPSAHSRHRRADVTLITTRLHLHPSLFCAGFLMNATTYYSTCSCGDTPLAIISSVIGILTFSYALFLGLFIYTRTAWSYTKDVAEAAAAFTYCQRRFKFVAAKLRDSERASTLPESESEEIVKEGFNILAEHETVAKQIDLLINATTWQRLLRALNWTDKNSELLSRLKNLRENLSALQDQLLFL